MVKKKERREREYQFCISYNKTKDYIFLFNLNLKEERNVDVCGDSLLNVKSMANFLHKEHRTSSYLPMHASSTN
jgi:hypothetical protein